MAEGLEATIVRVLTQRKQTLALAESCTGGFIAHRLTNVPGASAAFLNGFVTYSNASKQSMLGVHAETLQLHGAVSEATAREMAEGARKKSGADYSIAVTGIAGPAGGTLEKPVGTVFIAIAGEREIAFVSAGAGCRHAFRTTRSAAMVAVGRATTDPLRSW